MRRLTLMMAALMLLFACTPVETSTHETDEPGTGKDGNAHVTVEENLDPTVTVGTDNLSAVSVVLKGKANLGTTAASDLKIGFQYSKSAGILPTNSTTVDAQDADSDYNYTTTITGLEPDTKYYFRSFVRQNNQYTYGETKEFTTKDISAVLETLNATGIEATSAILNAKLDLTDVEYESIKHGFYWGTSEGSQNTFLNGEARDNAMTASMTGLNHKTQYWYKAYVKIDNQTFYGEVKTFTTDVVKVESISLDKTSLVLYRRRFNGTETITATVKPSDADNKKISWSSSNTKVASVSTSGVVTGEAPGSATITAEALDGSGVKATCEVEVRQYVTDITLVDLDLVIGEYVSASYNISPSNSTNSTLTWSSNNTSVVAVTDNGIVIAKSKGKATITASATDGSGVTATCNVVISTPAPEGAVYMGTHTSEGYRLYWAASNLSSSGLCAQPEDYGDYYAWGEVEPYYSSQDPLTWKEGKSNGYSGPSYKWCKGDYLYLTKYCPTDKKGFWKGEGSPDGKNVLEPEDDAAQVILGGKWRMPTDAEWKDLREKCRWHRYPVSTGVEGIGPNGKTIFLPAAGEWICTILQNAGSIGLYWSSSLGTSAPFRASLICSDKYDVCGGEGIRSEGISIRPVTE